MKRYSYYPFAANLDKVTADDLICLKEIAEGWYVDYKRQGLSIKEFAKHISAYANQYGGWLFIGVSECNDGSKKACEFSGIPKADAEIVSRNIREATASHVNPEVLYEEKILEGPCQKIGLSKGMAIIIIGVPMSLNTPHIHSSGRIYRRMADQSKPREVTDRYVLDDLWKRGRDNQEETTRFLTAIPELPVNQSETPWLHIYYKPAQYQQSPEKSLSYSEFKKVVRNDGDEVTGVRTPLQAVYTTVDGYVARQIEGADPGLATAGVRWWHNGTIRLDIPLSYHINRLEDGVSLYHGEFGREYCDIAKQQGFGVINIVDYSMAFQTIAAMTNLYLHMLSETGDKRDIFSCFTIRNIFHTSPYVDSNMFLERVRDMSIPVVTDRNIIYPSKPDVDNMMLHKFSSRNIDSSSVEDRFALPYVFTSLLVFKILKSVGVVSDLTEFINDEQMRGFNKVRIDK